MLPTRPELTGDFGMVASTHWLASAAGMSVLERGGNGFDAAAAAGFVLQVVEPHLNGPGGEVPILVWSEREQRVRVVCGQGVAPAAASRARLTGLGLDLVPGTGLLPATVPGAFGGWLAMLHRWGTWSPADVLAPAIEHAEAGVPVLQRIHDTIATVAPMLREHWPTSAATWLPHGRVPAVGGRLANPVLAGTLRRVVACSRAAGPDRDAQIEAARRCWYEGFVAETIAGFCAGRGWRDTSGAEHAGLLTGDDLAGWRAGVEDPVTVDYHGYTVCKTGPWGQGPVFAQQLALLAGVDLTAAGHLSADYVHTVVEAGKLAFADREAWYGDPEYTDVPLDTLLAPSYNDDRRALIGPAASRRLRPGSPDGRVPRLAPTPAPRAVDAAAGVIGGVGEPTVPAARRGETVAPIEARTGVEAVRADGRVDGDTCHLDVVDRWGNMVSATPSGGWLQSSPVVPGLGFCLGTRGQMFWLHDGLPNSLRPGARPRSTLSPSLALRDGRPWLAFGTPGGDQQDQWSLHFFLSLVHGGLGLQQAVDAPNFHSLHVPGSFYPRGSRPGAMLAERRLGPAVLAELRRRGHDVTAEGDWTLGRLSAVARDADAGGGGFLRAAANPRGAQGYAAGR